MAQLRMTKLIFATGSQTKLLDAQKAFQPLGIEVSGQKIEFDEKQSLDQAEIVRNKARQAYGAIRLPLFVDDTGFFIDSYSDFPGTLTKHINKTLGLSGIIKLFEEGQTAYFRTLICLIDDNSEIIAEGKLAGKLTKKISTKFNPETPLNSIFIPDGHNQPLIELVESAEIGNIHRINAINDLVGKLSN